jgi:hypothetical protein
MPEVIGRLPCGCQPVARAVVTTILVVTLAAPVLHDSVVAAPRTERCVRLEARMEQLRLRLRTGYTARQGRLWREQLRGLEAQYRVACR